MSESSFACSSLGVETPMELVNDRWTKGQTMKRGLLCASLWASLISSQGQGTILWDEAVNGPLSQNYEHPTILTPLQIGTNSLIGTSLTEWKSNNWFAQADYFLFQVAEKTRVSFVGATIDTPRATFWIGDSGFANQIAVAEILSGGALLSAWGIESVPPGAYGIELFNGNLIPQTTILNYRLDFVVDAIPEPASFWLLSASLAGMQIRRWLRKPTPVIH